MMDAVLCRFANNSDIGLVFADDPNPSDWNLNKEIAEGIAKRMGWLVSLPPHLVFPNGAMFWARPRALEPLLQLELDWEDYPGESLRYDGTASHSRDCFLLWPAKPAQLCHNLGSGNDKIARKCNCP